MLGNARLTGLTGAALLVLLAAEGATLLSLQRFVSWHILLGLALVPVVALKLGSTAYRLLRYYTGSREYVRAGPPPLVLRLLGPVLALSTAGLFGTGILLAAAGPSVPLALGLHKATFAVWVAAMTIHVLGHLARLPALAGPELRGGAGVGGSRLRLAALGVALGAGAIAAVAAIPLAAPWVHWVGSG
ncbi:MAG: hypothetical protein ACYDCH_07270 [Gaiellaceae bacterium]